MFGGESGPVDRQAVAPAGVLPKGALHGAALPGAVEEIAQRMLERGETIDGVIGWPVWLAEFFHALDDALERLVAVGTEIFQTVGRDLPRILRAGQFRMQECKNTHYATR